MLTIWSSSYENRLKVVDDTIYDWATFSKLDQMNVFEDVKAKSWEEGPFANRCNLMSCFR